LHEAEDSEIWEYALTKQYVIITEDQDFFERQLANRSSPIIVWLRIGNTSNRALVEWLLPLWPEVIARIESVDKLVEVRDGERRSGL
jgi:predicted nuclease of predicted toxin-antitoxin system